MSPLAALRAALGMFTVLPVPPTLRFDERTARAAVLALPWAGLVSGVMAGAAGALVLASGAGGELASVMGLATLAGLTGALHLDGLADTADGLGSRRPAQEALDIMRRSDIGPMGVVTLVLVLALQATALASLAGPPGATPSPFTRWGLVAALATAPLVGRVGVVLATVQAIPGARGEGFGALFVGVTSRRAATATGISVLAAVAMVAWAAEPHALSWAWSPASAVFSWVVADRWRTHLVRRLGGLTGDTFGSLIEVTQTAYLVSLALLTGFARTAA